MSEPTQGKTDYVADDGNDGWGDWYGCRASGPEVSDEECNAYIERLRRENDEWQDLVHDAWGVIANAGFQPGEEKTHGWHEAAIRWRDRMHEVMGIGATDAR